MAPGNLEEIRDQLTLLQTKCSSQAFTERKQMSVLKPYFSTGVQALAQG